MGETTGISWTTSTFNPWIGCTKVSPGCDNCYAETLDKRWGHDNWGKGKPRRKMSNANWHKPITWNREAEKTDKPWYVFCGSFCDVMDDEAPEGAREYLWNLIDETPRLTWQLLTKRPSRYHRYLRRDFRHRNVWVGTSCENQDYYDTRWPVLSTVSEDFNLTSFISYEPALGPLTMRPHHNKGFLGSGLPDWIICGGESGPNRRPMEQVWAEDLKAECEANGVKFFMKQFSARTPEQGAALIPVHLLVRQFPETR